jgi:hypothetical protein
MKLSAWQKVILWCVAAIGLFGINGLFVYSMAVRPWEMKGIQTNLCALAFMLEAFLLLPLFCYLIAIAKLKSPGWITFLILSLLGSLAFSIPFSILMWNRNAEKKN